MSTLPTDLIAPFLPSQRGSADEVCTDWKWKETPESHIFKFDLPGFSKSDIHIDVHSDTRILHITTLAERIDEEEAKGVTWHCKERVRSGNFSKKFRLPENARIDGISASMKDGVLVVTVAKENEDEGEGTEVEKIRRRSVAIEGEDDDLHRHGRKGRVLGKCFVCCKP